MADARLTAAKLLLKMDSSESYSNILLGSALTGSGLSDRDKSFVSALFYGVTERRMTLNYVIKNSLLVKFMMFVRLFVMNRNRIHLYYYVLLLVMMLVKRLKNYIMKIMKCLIQLLWVIQRVLLKQND